MELLRIRGGPRLEGSVAISGSKNASLPVMAAALLTDQEVELGNVPDIEDISTMAQMLDHVGVTVEHPDTHTWRLHAATLRTTEVDPNLSRRMRGSFLLLGALVARAGEASIAKPGGDDIGCAGWSSTWRGCASWVPRSRSTRPGMSLALTA